jgi:hypothetical protein
MSNLPEKIISDSGGSTKLFFDLYGREAVEFSANDVDASVGFFKGKGFLDDAAVATGFVILKRAKAEGRPVFELLDTLKDLNGIQLSELIARILNSDRRPTSVLGFRSATSVPKNIARSIRP